MVEKALRGEAGHSTRTLKDLDYKVKVPQGSILGPLHFRLYVCYLPAVTCWLLPLGLHLSGDLSGSITVQYPFQIG